MNVEVKFFGQLADLSGSDTIKVQDVVDTESLRRKLILDYPQLDKYSFQMAVNKKIAKGNQMLSDGCVVALLPPFAGG
jgi:molybdopterin synthase sulfur carrier subunit